MGLLLFFSCQKKETQNDDVVSQQFIHKYGIQLSQEEWENRKQEGQVITHLDNGVIAKHSYSQGILHGPCSFTYPDSEVIEQLLVYNEGTLTKKVHYDEAGRPVFEEVYDLDNRNTITHWNQQGVPLSVEEYNEGLLVKGEYFDENHECEAMINEGTGYRIHRDRISNLLLSKDTFQDGVLIHRSTYHPNGSIQSENSYCNYLLHGKQITFSETGNPLMEATWHNGEMHGMKYLYANGIKTAEIPYFHGKKQGMERHFDTNSNLIAEIQWNNDQRHGSSRFYGDEKTQIDWFFRGQNVSLNKFQKLEFREQLMAELEKEDTTKETLREQKAIR